MMLFLTKVIIFNIILLIVSSFWLWLEIIILGHPNPNMIDTIIGIILTYSLYLNVMNKIEIKVENTH